MAHLIFHAGFHKTGTTSVQQTLRLNRQALRPYAQIVLRPGMTGLCEAARAWSASRSDVDMALLKYEAANLAEQFGGSKTVILSSEDLSGHMPGRKGLRSYDAAPFVMRALVETVLAVRRKARITLVFSTRAAEPWLRSCHAQHLGTVRMKLSAQDYAQTYASSANLRGIVEDIRKAVPKAEVSEFALEDVSRGLGPAGPILTLAGVPHPVQLGLQAAAPANPSPPSERAAKLLELNRSNLTNDALRAAKQTLRAPAED